MPALFLGLGLFSSCSEEKDAMEDQNMEVSFELNLSDMVTRTLVDQPKTDDDTDIACPEPDDTGSWFVEGKYAAHIEIALNGGSVLTPYEPVKLIRKSDGSIVTDKIMLVKPISGGKHQLAKLFIYNNDSTDPEFGKVIYSSVGNGSKYESHVLPEHVLPMDLMFEENLLTSKKPIIPVSLLCAVYDEAPDFGFAIWGLNFVKVVCFDYVVDIPEDFCDRNSQDIVGSSDLVLVKKIKNDKGEEVELTHQGSSSDGQKGTICFNDQGNIDDANESYTLTLYIPNKTNPQVIVSGTMTLEQMYGYKCSGFWEVPEGAAADKGVIHFDLYETDLTKTGPVFHNGAICEEPSPWALYVTKPYECPSECGVICETPFLSDFKTFKLFDRKDGFCPDKCDWIHFGFIRYFLTDNSLNAYTFGCLQTPVKDMKKDDIIMVEYGHGKNSIVNVSLINIEAPLSPIDLTAYQTTPVNSDKSKYYYKVPADGCYRIMINNCCGFGLRIYDMTYTHPVVL